MSQARRAYEFLRRQLHDRGLLRPRYLQLGDDVVRLRRELDEAMREVDDATPEPPRFTKEETDEYFGVKKS